MNRTLFHFRTTPKLGRTITVDGQRYVLIDTRLHRRLDDAYTMILTWQSDCPVCGNPFATTSGLSAKSINRRCELHKRPGTPVKTDRRMPRHPSKGMRHD